MMRLAGYTPWGQGVGKVFRGRRWLREEEELPRCVRASGTLGQSFCLEVVKQNWELVRIHPGGSCGAGTRA